MTPTPEQVAQWAREAGLFRGENLWLPDYTNALQRLATRAFTEGCAWQAEQDARVCDAMQYEKLCTPENCAAAIRANAPKGTM